MLTVRGPRIACSISRQNAAPCTKTPYITHRTVYPCAVSNHTPRRLSSHVIPRRDSIRPQSLCGVHRVVSKYHTYTTSRRFTYAIDSEKKKARQEAREAKKLEPMLLTPDEATRTILVKGIPEEAGQTDVMPEFPGCIAAFVKLVQGEHVAYVIMRTVEQYDDVMMDSHAYVMRKRCQLLAYDGQIVAEKTMESYLTVKKELAERTLTCYAVRMPKDYLNKWIPNTHVLRIKSKNSFSAYTVTWERQREMRAFMRDQAEHMYTVAGCVFAMQQDCHRTRTINLVNIPPDLPLEKLRAIIPEAIDISTSPEEPIVYATFATITDKMEVLDRLDTRGLNFDGRQAKYYSSKAEKHKKNEMLRDLPPRLRPDESELDALHGHVYLCPTLPEIHTFMHRLADTLDKHPSMAYKTKYRQFTWFKKYFEHMLTIVSIQKIQKTLSEMEKAQMTIIHPMPENANTDEELKTDTTIWRNSRYNNSERQSSNDNWGGRDSHDSDNVKQLFNTNWGERISGDADNERQSRNNKFRGQNSHDTDYDERSQKCSSRKWTKRNSHDGEEKLSNHKSKSRNSNDIENEVINCTWTTAKDPNS